MGKKIIQYNQDAGLQELGVSQHLLPKDHFLTKQNKKNRKNLSNMTREHK